MKILIVETIQCGKNIYCPHDIVEVPEDITEDAAREALEAGFAEELNDDAEKEVETLLEGNQDGDTPPPTAPHADADPGPEAGADKLDVPDDLATWNKTALVEFDSDHGLGLNLDMSMSKATMLELIYGAVEGA